MPEIKRGSISNILRFTLKNSSTGAGLTGLTSSSTGLIISTICDNEATAAVYTVAAGNVETITALGTYAAPTSGKCRFKEIDAANHKGLYEFQFADARFSVASSKRLIISVTGATGLLDADYEVELPDNVAKDAYDIVSHASYGNAQLVRSTTPANTLDVSATGEAGLDFNNIKDATGAKTLTNITVPAVTTLTGHTAQTGDTYALANGANGFSALKTDTAAILLDTGTDGVVVAAGSKTGYSLTQSFPANFADLAITATTGRVTVGTNADKTGYSISGAKTTLDALNDITAASVWSVATRALTDKAGFELSAAGVQAIWDALTSALTAAGSIGKWLVDRLDALISSRLASASYTAPDNAGISAIKAKTDNLPEGFKKNQAFNNFMFLMVDSTDNKTGKTGLTITASRSIDGAAFAACANSAVEVGSGFYKINLAASDENGDIITYKFSAPLANDRFITIKTSP